MNPERTCLVLIRDPLRARDRSDILFRSIVEPAASAAGFRCVRVDPADYGQRDEYLFRLLETSDVVVVDAAAKSPDYLYSLGVRHALTHKPTIVLVEANYLPFDVRVPEGVCFIEPGIKNQAGAMTRLLDEFRRSPSVMSYSPVKAALEEVPRVFLSYAHADRDSVAAVDQWLRDRGARVEIDERDFIAGRDIRDEIVNAIRRAGKVVCFYSRSSADRYYTKLERRLSEEAELQAADRGKAILVYFRLDDTSLPAESSYRLAINAWTMGFEVACRDLWRHLLEKPAEPQRISLAQYRDRAPWERRATDEDAS